MTIEIPCRPRRHGSVAAATALYIPSRDLNVLFAQCGRLGLDPAGRLFDVAGGFLLELVAPSTDPAPGAVRLRALYRSLYLPVDAELVPGLLDDEASGLVRDWGLVFLPGGRTLLFDRHAPIELTELLRAQPEAEPVRGRAWSSFPEGGQLADRLVQIAIELPPEPPEALYDSFKQSVRGGEGLSTWGRDLRGIVRGRVGRGRAGRSNAGTAGRGRALRLGDRDPRAAGHLEPGGAIDRGAEGKGTVGLGRPFRPAAEAGARVPRRGPRASLATGHPDHGARRSHPIRQGQSTAVEPGDLQPGRALEAAGTR